MNTALIVSILVISSQPRENLNGLILNGETVLLPRVKTFCSGMKFNICLYSVFAGYIIRKERCRFFRRVIQVLVFPEPVTPHTKACFWNNDCGIT